MITETITTALQQILEKLGVQNPKIELSHPTELSHGDYATNIALAYAKELGTNPRVLAEKIVAEFSKNLPLEIEKLEIAGPGFINIFLSKDFFASEIQKIIEVGLRYGENSVGKGKTVIVEFSSPNIAKPFTIGHLRSTIIGDAVANILTISGYHVIRDNHLGDWGTQFGKLIVAIKKWNGEEILSDSKNPVKDLVALYVKFHEEAEKDVTLEDEARAWFTKLEQGDAEAHRIWKKCIDWSMIEFGTIYNRLGVKFDTMLGESCFEDKMQEVVKDLKEKKLLKESDGANLVFFKEEKYPPLMILKKDGSTLYATRDLATDKYRKETYHPDLVINEVGIEQSLYFKQLFEVEEMLGYFSKDKRVHIAHGLYRFKEGKMSTRKGNAIWLDDVLDQAARKAKEAGSSESIVDAVAIGGLKFNDLKREPTGFINFDWDEILNIKGDSGTYVQYTVARSNSILEKANEIGLVVETLNSKNKRKSDLERLVVRFPEIVLEATKRLQPHHIAQYMLLLAQEFNSWYGMIKVIDSENPDAPYNLALVYATKQVLKNGLQILGIQTPEKM